MTGEGVGPDTVTSVGGNASSPGGLRALIDGAPVAFWSCMPDGQADFFNRRWLTYLNLESEIARGTGWTALVHPEDVQGHVAAWQRSLRTSCPFEYESRIRGPDGVYRWFLALAEPVRDAAGRIVSWCGTNIDIESRKRAEADLRRSEAFLAEAQRLSRTGSFSWTPFTDRMYWSQESFRIFEIDRAMQPSLGAIRSRVHPDDRTAVEEILKAGLTGEAIDVRCRIRLSDERVKYIRIVDEPWRAIGQRLTRALSWTTPRQNSPKKNCTTLTRRSRM